jgi:NAD(P)-dependent dehydrogenase (short-subunit alcohol dehydrogenase family)
VVDPHTYDPGVPVAVVLGARNLGGAIADHLLSEGWSAAAVAQSDETLERVRARGIHPLRADASHPGELATALQQAREQLGGLDLVVNAVSAARPPAGTTAFGGGPLADAGVEDFRGWTAAVAEQAFVFLSEGIKALRAAAGGGTLVQVTGGSSRRAMPGRGLWSAGAQATRALVQAAAQELREENIHAALLIVDGTIESPKTEAFTRDMPREALADQGDVARAVAYLASQSARGMTHELQLTPAGDRWVP